MMTYQATPDFYRDYIQHFNPFHDPRNGQFSSKKGGSTKAIKKDVNINKVQKKYDKLYNRAEKEVHRKGIGNFDAFGELYPKYYKMENKLYDKYKVFDPDEEESETNKWDPEGDRIREKKLESEKNKLWDEFYDKVDKIDKENIKKAIKNTKYYKEIQQLEKEYGTQLKKKK